MNQPHCVVVGAGVVGIATGIALRKQGISVTLIDPNPPGSMTSKGNAGGFGVTEVMPIAAPGVMGDIPKWLINPRGPLSIRFGCLFSLMPWLTHFRRVSRLDEVHRIAQAMQTVLSVAMDDTRSMTTGAGLNHLLTEKGAITVYRSKKEFVKDRLQWEIKREYGVRFEYVDQAKIKEMEPALENVSHGWFTPDWCNTIDPYRLSLGLLSYFQRLGGHVLQHEVLDLIPQEDDDWKVIVKEHDPIMASRVVLSAGVWSKLLCEQLGERVLLESERGYNATLPDPNVYLDRQVIFGAEKFVASNIGNGMRIGGAAEFAGLDAPPNFRRSERLLRIAKRYLPELDTQGSEHWMGHRPSTPDSMPVISESAIHRNLFYGFGHGHLGLTMAATTGRLLTQLVIGEKPDIDLSPFSIRRFERDV